MNRREGEPLDADGRIGFADFHEGYLARYIQLADAKAGTVLVAVTLVIGYMLGSGATVAVLRSPAVTWSFAATGLSLLLLIASAWCGAMVVWPRTGGVDYGLVFWARVAGMSEQDYIEAVGQAGPEGIAHERLRHCHALAGVCTAKYWWLRASFVTGAFALAAAGACRLLVGN